MRTILLKLLMVFLATTVFGLAGCGGGGSDSGATPTTVANIAPVANAGAVQSVGTGAVVTLDGSASSDANGDLLTYSWAFTSKPAGSSAALSSATAAKPAFTADVAGAYVLNLVVNDGKVSSAAVTVTITAAIANAAPVANAGVAQSVAMGTNVMLDASSSSDLDGDPLTYNWSFTSKPAGSGTALSSSTAAKPTFTTDVVGTYDFLLEVSDGIKISTATVTIFCKKPIEAFFSIANNSSVSVGQSLSVAENGTFVPISMSFGANGVTGSGIISGFVWNFNDGQIYGEAGNDVSAIIVNNTNNNYVVPSFSLLYGTYGQDINVVASSQTLYAHSYIKFVIPLDFSSILTNGTVKFQVEGIGYVDGNFLMNSDIW